MFTRTFLYRKMIQQGFVSMLLMMLMVTLLTACSEDEAFNYDVVPVHQDPVVQLSSYVSDLAASAHGWEGVLTPKTGKVYRLHVTFENSTLKMLADVDTVSARDASASAYMTTVKDHQPVIVFAAGSHLDRMQTPDNSDGVDHEYTIIGKEGASIVFIGNTFGDKLILTPASPEFAQQFKDGAIKRSIKGITGYLPTVRLLYFEPVPGKKIQFIVRSGLRSTYFTYVENEKAKFFGSDYSYTKDGIALRSSKNIHGVDVANLGFDESSNKFYVVVNGSRLYAMESLMPLIPLHYLMGTEFDTGIRLVAPWLVQQPGWSYKFLEQWTLTDFDLDESEYGLSLFTVVVDLNPDNNTMKLIVQTLDLYSRTEIAEYPYKFSKSAGGIFDFEPLPIDTSTARGQYADDLQDELAKLLHIIDNYSYSIDFYDNSGVFMPQYQSQEDIEMYFTGDFY